MRIAGESERAGGGKKPRSVSVSSMDTSIGLRRQGTCQSDVEYALVTPKAAPRKSAEEHSPSVEEKCPKMNKPEPCV